MPKRREIELFYSALDVARVRGEDAVTRDDEFRIYDDGHLRITYSGPSEELPPSGAELRAKELEVQHGEPGRSLPHGLQVYAPGNVLNVEWSDDGPIFVIGYSPGGPWEQELEKLAREIAR
ncbi:hypothetical protein [Bradyrhizobium zhanjiangense]|uniref:Uncharacterized protein n=1 Tax=Bradyrhizobium zhanjiangense TaxID=1325107 RepID=A0A4V1L4D3_9BRAD|nr:hypothetical protein [Bradyrhizobium zhanjiangense]RXH41074.1 hypothetical protein XH94_09530 [Bradyrhizobium zhanjiangense]